MSPFWKLTRMHLESKIFATNFKKPLWMSLGEKDEF